MNCDGSVGDADEDEDGLIACEDCDDTDPDDGAVEYFQDLVTVTAMGTSS